MSKPLYAKAFEETKQVTCGNPVDIPPSDFIEVIFCLTKCDLNFVGWGIYECLIICTTIELVFGVLLQFWNLLPREARLQKDSTAASYSPHMDNRSHTASLRLKIPISMRCPHPSPHCANIYVVGWQYGTFVSAMLVAYRCQICDVRTFNSCLSEARILKF